MIELIEYIKIISKMTSRHLWLMNYYKANFKKFYFKENFECEFLNQF